MNPKCLHIWPRGSYMMIALPNQDCSWTVTLFMPFEMFEQLTTPDKLIKFFETNYPDSLPLIGKERLVKDYFATKPSGLVTIKVSYSIQRETCFICLTFRCVKCYPYQAGKAVIMGDAAHAMCPFYGQGMNAVSLLATHFRKINPNDNKEGEKICRVSKTALFLTIS